ncbi:MAG TPA: 1-phosphofructokinase family hexose kinase [Pyrinomonadaceae bacterium]|nr:1-phosphofructokinase family hexose kinase [Pyrinomonadaceae bacterium]
MILIVNLNLAVDEIVHLDGLTVGEVHRTTHVERLAGGKGVNAARVLKALKEPAHLTGFLGGRAGELITSELQREELSSSYVRIKNESRTCIILDDATSRAQTVINEAGPLISEEEQAAFLEHYAQLLSTASIVIITGSLPPAIEQDFYARLIRMANEHDKQALLDTSSEALRRGVEARPFFVKINGAEAGALLRLQINGPDEARRASRALIEAGASHAMVTLGEAGAALNFRGAEYLIKAPRVEARNSVGSGDAVMAGIAAALVRGLDAEEMARLSIAAGAANALRGAGRCREEDINRLAREVELLRLN